MRHAAMSGPDFLREDPYESVKEAEEFIARRIKLKEAEENAARCIQAWWRSKGTGDKGAKEIIISSSLNINPCKKNKGLCKVRMIFRCEYEYEGLRSVAKHNPNTYVLNIKHRNVHGGRYKRPRWLLRPSAGERALMKPNRHCPRVLLQDAF